jgi:selenide,water dikinase
VTEAIEIAQPLTSFSSGSGCGCKLAAGTLLPLVRSLSTPADPRVLVGCQTGDDAAVVLVRHDLALVHTVDFFTPVVDDPYDFGRIAATNALSDIYAMGAEPLCALNLVAFPLERLGIEVLGEILRGGGAAVTAAGASIVGGHSIDDPEPKYGLAVTGTIHPRALLRNATGRAGDALVLTKPLGVGAIIAGRKRGVSSDVLLASAVETMTTLNASAARAARAAGAHAMTDVTGFGLLGHLGGLARESGLEAHLDAASVPALEGVEGLLRDGTGVSGGTRRNADYAASFVHFAEDIPDWRRWLLSDATTSGGLLVTIPPAQARAVPGTIIGRLADGRPGRIEVA